MCGIIGGFGLNIGPQILLGLQRLEYRGYDSFGLSLDGGSNTSSLIRRIGAPSSYSYESFELDKHYTFGVGHTRWATHGGVTENNAHPHCAQSRLGRLSIVHNGVVENVAALKSLLLQAYQQKLKSQTDTEVILMHIAQKIDVEHLSVDQALSQVLTMIHGSFAIILIEHRSEHIWAVKQDLPLFYVPGQETKWLLSDLQALSFIPESAHLLQDRQIFKLTSEQGLYFNSIIMPNFFAPEKENLVLEQHLSQELLFTEIAHQPQALAELLRRQLPEIDCQHIKEYHLIGCGSSYHAAQLAAQLLEGKLKKSLRVFIASEFRSYPPHIPDGAALIVLSQSGETADVLAALREQGQYYNTTVGICNRQGSMLSRLVQHCYYLEIGAERSVASTKAFTAQVLMLCRLLDSSFSAKEMLLSEHWGSLSRRLLSNPIWQQWAHLLKNYPGLMILGRGPLWAVAQEGALKMKELTYCHVHALAASELKHGSLALIDKSCPVVMLIPTDTLWDKNILAVHEVMARGADVFVIVGENAVLADLPPSAHIATIPSIQHVVLQSLLFTLPLQMIAGLWAKSKGLNVDRPRNLAKSVTVE